MTIWYVVILLILAFYIFGFLTKRKTASRPDLAIVIGLLDNIGYNQDLIGKKRNNDRTKTKFKVFNWEMNRKRLNFLGPELESDINGAFSHIAEINAKIDSAKTNNAISLTDGELDSLMEALTGIGAVLIDWLKSNPEP